MRCAFAFGSQLHSRWARSLVLFSARRSVKTKEISAMNLRSNRRRAAPLHRSQQNRPVRWRKSRRRSVLLLLHQKHHLRFVKRSGQQESQKNRPARSQKRKQSQKNQRPIPRRRQWQRNLNTLVKRSWRKNRAKKRRQLQSPAKHPLRLSLHKNGKNPRAQRQNRKVQRKN